MIRFLVLTGLVAVAAVAVWAGTIQPRIWGYPQQEIDPNLLTALIQQTADPNAELRVRAIEELARLRTAKAMTPIAERLADKAVVQTEAGRVTVAAVACAALGLLGDRQAVPYLIPLLEDEQLRAIASRALCLLKNPLRIGRLKVADLLGDSAAPAGQTRVSDLHDPVCGSDPANWQAWWTRQGLVGREIFVRVYKDPHGNPASFELVKAKAAKDDVPRDAIPGADPCSIVVICGQDQQDEDLRVMMGRWVTARCVGDGKGLSVPDRMWQYPGISETPDRWLFDDALGEPIHGASVEVWLTGSDKAGKVHRIRFGQWVAPENGIEAIRVSGGFTRWFVVSHPDYGKVSALGALHQVERIRTQLVRLGSEVGNRAIWGTVVDESGRPVQDATIECRSVRTLGDGLINPDYRYGRGEAITDANGFFSLYVVPRDQFAEQRGTLIPPGSRYQVVVKPPASRGLTTFEGPVANGAPARIVLERPGGQARTFVFETDDGAMKDPERLKDITIVVQRPGKTPLTYPYAQWNAGRAMPDGTYLAALKNGGSVVRFEPLLVSETSSDVLVFHPQLGVVCSGRVVDAKTGLPLPGVFVLVENARGQGRFSDFTDEQWSHLEQLGTHPDEDDEAMKPVGGVYRFVDVARTDADGSYEVRADAGVDFYGLLFFARDYVPTQYRKAGLTPDPSGRTDVPEIRLYPAAKVSMQVQTSVSRVSIAAHWRVEKDQAPAWARDLCLEPPAHWLSLEYSYWYAPNVTQWVFVPADVLVQLVVSAPYADELCPFRYPQSVCLVQGATTDLGPCTLPQAMTVVVQVLDRQGRPREGIPIGRQGGDAPRPMHNTDENGLASIYVPPHSSGRFFVVPPMTNVGKGRGLPPEAVSFEVGGPEDQGKQFTLVLSDEMLSALFKDSGQPQR